MNVIVKATNLCIDFPIYGTSSLKNRVLSGVTGGAIKAAGKTRIVRALNDVSFTFYEGDRVGLYGHNGSGKTTLLRTLTGIYYPTTGELTVNGKVTPLLNISLGMEQDATGYENICLRAAMMGFKQKEIDKKIDEIIDYSELGNFVELPMRTYSAGMQLRLAFSVSTCIQSDILLMDEWLSVGDESFTKKASERLNSLKNNSKLFVLASHNYKLLEKTCNRIIHLEHGKISRETTQTPQTDEKKVVFDI